MDTITVIADGNTMRRVVLEVAEVLTEDPATCRPPSLVELMVMELQGMIWNFETGAFEPEDR